MFEKGFAEDAGGTTVIHFNSRRATKAKSDWAQPYSIKSNVNAETKSSLIVSLLLQDRAIVVHTLTQKQS